MFNCSISDIYGLSYSAILRTAQTKQNRKKSSHHVCNNFFFSLTDNRKMLDMRRSTLVEQQFYTLQEEAAGISAVIKVTQLHPENIRKKTSAFSSHRRKKD